MCSGYLGLYLDWPAVAYAIALSVEATPVAFLDVAACDGVDMSCLYTGEFAATLL